MTGRGRLKTGDAGSEGSCAGGASSSDNNHAISGGGEGGEGTGLLLPALALDGGILSRATFTETSGESGMTIGLALLPWLFLGFDLDVEIEGPGLLELDFGLVVALGFFGGDGLRPFSIASSAESSSSITTSLADIKDDAVDVSGLGDVAFGCGGSDLAFLLEGFFEVGTVRPCSSSMSYSSSIAGCSSHIDIDSFGLSFAFPFFLAPFRSNSLTGTKPVAAPSGIATAADLRFFVGRDSSSPAFRFPLMPPLTYSWISIFFSTHSGFKSLGRSRSTSANNWRSSPRTMLSWTSL